MKKILIGIMLLLTIASVSAEQCYFGDTNNDCLISGEDVALCNQFVLSKAIIDNPLQADLNGNGILDGTDCDIMQKITLSKPVTIDGVPSISSKITPEDPLFDINNINQGDVEVFNIFIGDIDGTPRQNIKIDFLSDIVTLDKTNGLTDVNGIIQLQATFSQAGNGYINFLMEGDAGKQIQEFDVTYNGTIIPTPTPTPPQPNNNNNDNNDDDDEEIPTCLEENYLCDEWNECQGHGKIGSQSRECVNSEICEGGIEPKTLKDCDMPSQVDEVEGDVIEFMNKEPINERILVKKKDNLIWYLISIFGIGIFIFICIYLKYRKE